MSRQRLARRLQAVEGRTVAGIHPAKIARMAAEVGCTPEALIADAEALVRQFEREGAQTWDQRLAIVARDRGVPVDELRAELEAIGAMPQ